LVKEVEVTEVKICLQAFFFTTDQNLVGTSIAPYLILHQSEVLLYCSAKRHINKFYLPSGLPSTVKIS